MEMTLTPNASPEPAGAWYRTDPLTRLVISIGTVVAAVLLDGVVCLLLLGLVAVVIPASAAGVARRVLAMALVLALPLALSAVLVNVLFSIEGTVVATLGPLEITEEGIALAAMVATRVVAMAGAAVLFYVTTPPARLVSSLQSHGAPARLTFVIYNGVAMIPRLADRASEVTAAQRARGLDSEGRIWRRARGVVAVSVPTVLSAVHEVETRTLALETRGFTRPGRPTPLWTPPDSSTQRFMRWGVVVAVGGLALARFVGGPLTC
jgi:energy-coupling factor transport system permease protein